MRQVTEIFEIFIIFFFLQIPFLIAFNLFKKNKLLTNIRFIAITAYVVVIVQLTLWPTVAGQFPIGWSEVTYNFKPFHSILGSLNHPYYLVGVRNVLGNFVLILPLALFIKLKGTMRILLLGFGISLGIEVVQAIFTMSGLILRRSFDVDDLILNTSGFYAGYLIRAIAIQFGKFNQPLLRWIKNRYKRR
ncbi:VanZ family protein [Paenibacillus harenae]|uniref:VanZ family protein n=1 Tax=Paenibacillus harenae TaxID=306543 RepID=UPI00278D76D2|nr:VanZ family protein [Paenibacillus harenae]MDQ0060062.1 glycopeptide antibiotics resistance protein [Paenibacillus harenae]